MDNLKDTPQEAFEKLTKMIDQFVADHNYMDDKLLKMVLQVGEKRIQKYIYRQNRYIGE